MTLFDLFRRSKPAAQGPEPVQATPAPRGTASPDPDEDLLRYPPFIKGLPASDVDALLAKQAELIRRLQDGVGMTDTDYRQLVLPVVRRLAAFVHLLPASEAHHHRGSGGLLRHSLEVGFLASQASMRHVFALDREPKDRYHLEPRWRVASGLAGLLHDIGKPVADLTVSDRDGTLTWCPHEEPLLDWARRHGLQRYYLRWRETRRHNAHLQMGTLVVHAILTPEIKTWLSRDPAILANLIAVVGGQEETSVVGTVVGNADRASVARDLRENRIDPDAFALGVPVDRYLIDAMRRLVREGTWTVNTPGARLWMLADGLHVVWPQGGEDIAGLLARDKIPGIPKAPETIADILVERGHVTTYREEERDRFYRSIAPAPLVKDGKPVQLTMLLLASPELVFAGHPPAPVARWQDGARCAPVRDDDTVELIMSDADALDTPDTEATPAAPQVRLPTASDRTRATHVEPPGTIPAAVSAEPDPTETRTPSGSQDPTGSAHSWLADRGTGGLALITLLRSIADGERPAEILARHDRHLLIPYPEGLTALVVPGIGMEPADVLHALWDGGLLAIDPRRPLLRVREIDGRMRAMLTVEASAAVTTLLDRLVEPAVEPLDVPPCDRVATDPLGVAPGTDDPAGAADAIDPPESRPGATALATDPPKPPPRKSAARAFAEDLATQCRDGRVPTTALPNGLLIDHATLAALASEHRIPPSKLLRRFKHQPDFIPDTRGIILAGRP
ncbi:MobH family relaxase [Thiocapsa rosea]|uniref:Conjugal transfer pilus assembly protein TraI n=1 Tax=Thiocapsa rosea TaxID=69360 RepID=A0A495VAN8_9GAMM|nr:MobH family relaxase [Thiocapsa rosea]RKT45515.1 conjugal transfer pilus assembly protein TraI [Thiocapsa rosea]